MIFVKIYKLICSGKISLKVHKIENFFGFDFEFYTVSLLVMLKYEGFEQQTIFDWTIMGGGRIIPRSPKTTGNENFFKPRPKFFFCLKS